MPKLDLKFLHKGQNLYIENNVMGIHFKSSKSQYEDSGETTSHLDIQMDLSEIHVHVSIYLCFLSLCNSD